MLQWLKKFNATDFQIKLFIFMVALYGIAMAVTTVYSYARLDYVRSYKTTTPKINAKS